MRLLPLFLLLPVASCGEDRDAANDRVTAIFANGMQGPILDNSGRSIGKVTATPSKEGLVVAFDVSRVSPGRHAIHLHEIGRCDPPDFDSAGAHWNTSGHEHGTDNPKGPHDGDWDNLDVAANGEGSTDRLIPRWHGKIPQTGLSLVIHAGKDDEMSQPEGGSGERIACAAIIQPA